MIQLFLRQPGVIKKLQLALFLSLSVNLFLVFGLLKKSAASKVKNRSVQILEKNEEAPAKNLSGELKAFIYKYLEAFFATDLISDTFIEKHSNSDFWQDILVIQREQRKQLNQASKFFLSDIYLEPQDGLITKVIVIGEEIFDDKQYVNRKITMTLLINNSELFVESIPQFDIT